MLSNAKRRAFADYNEDAIFVQKTSHFPMPKNVRLLAQVELPQGLSQIDEHKPPCQHGELRALPFEVQVHALPAGLDGAGLDIVVIKLGKVGGNRAARLVDVESSAVGPADRERVHVAPGTPLYTASPEIV